MHLFALCAEKSCTTSRQSGVTVPQLSEFGVNRQPIHIGILDARCGCHAHPAIWSHHELQWRSAVHDTYPNGAKQGIRISCLNERMWKHVVRCQRSRSAMSCRNLRHLVAVRPPDTVQSSRPSMRRIYGRRCSEIDGAINAASCYDQRGEGSAPLRTPPACR